jgi:hypothetical protein
MTARAALVALSLFLTAAALTTLALLLLTGGGRQAIRSPDDTRLDCGTRPVAGHPKAVYALCVLDRPPPWAQPAP